MFKQTNLDQLLGRGVAEVLPNRESLESLLNLRKVRVYLGIDPSGAQLTLGHAVVLKKLQQFVDLGHEVILLIGNATVRIGDPTGKDKTRPQLSDEVIDQHFATWKEQAEKVVDFSKIQIMKNGDWLDKLSLPDFIKLLASSTVQQLLERDMFQDRLKNNQPLFTHELIYPLLQGYDSVAMDVDVEIGGTDQTFNMMVGRTILKQYKNKEKWVLTVPLLVGSDGRKMGKSLNNFIALAAPAKDQFFQLMQVTDEVVFDYLSLLTDLSIEEIESRKQDLQSEKLHPMDLKKEMATLIVTWLHDAESAEQAKHEFEQTVQQKELPADLLEIIVPENCTAKELLIETHGKHAQVSASELVRLMQQGAVKLNDKLLQDPFEKIELLDNAILRVGKRNVYRVVPSKQ